MSLRLWSSRDPLDPGFERAWRDRLGRASHTHFGFHPDYLAHEARRGRHVLAVLLDRNPRGAAMVLRPAGGGLVSGWPWRWHVVVEGIPDAGAAGISPPDTEWLFSAAENLSGRRRVRFYLPGSMPAGGSVYVAGGTYMQALHRSEEVLFGGLHEAKRRMVRRAQSRGYEIVEARDPELFRSFARLQRETEARRGDRPGRDEGPPGSGQGGREWELPWMWLLVAVRDGEVEAGSGFGTFPGGSVDYRANASTLEARKDGANVLLAWEAMRLARERGFRWINWCGATRFKRELGGERVDIRCRLGGGPVWAVPNHLVVSARRARSRLVTLLRRRSQVGVGRQRPRR